MARVRVVQVSTGLERETQSDADGYFALTSIPPGDIDVVVSAQGFAERRLQGVRLEVGQAAEVEIAMQLSAVQEQVTVAGDAGTVNVLDAGLSTVISAREIESLPLNGRNFLELAFLTPGSAPAPNFDPTKAQSVIVSSAGQAGRGGNITIDGQDDNDDVVGGPLLNISQDAVQEFQVATNRFTAELGRSAGSVINVVTRSGGEIAHGSSALFLRDQSWQALPELLDADEAGDPPFDRQQASFTLGGPLGLPGLFGFGALEIRNQDGGVLVGVRDPAARAIDRTYATAPLDDLLGTFRLNWAAGSKDDVTIRYTGQREDDIAASTVERPIGTASQRQESQNRLQAVLGSWSRILSPRAVNSLSVSFSTFDNRITPVEPGAQLTFPSIQAGSSFRVPQGTSQTRWQVADTLSLARGRHQWKVGGQLQRVDADFDLGVFRDGRIELVEDFPEFDRNGDGRINDDDLLFAVTLRSGKPDQDLVIPDADNVYLAGFIQDDWRMHPQLSLNLGLRYEIDTDVNNLSRVDELNPIVAPFVTEPRRRDTNNWAPRIGFNWSTPDARTSVRGGYGLYYDRVTLQIQSLERGLDGRALPIEVRAGNLLFIDPATGRVPPGAPSLSNPFTGFILPGAGASGINIIDSRLQNPKVHQMSLGFERQLGSRQVIRDRRGAQPRQRLHHRTNGRHGVQPGRRRPRPRRQPRVERGKRLRRDARRVRAALLRPLRVPRRLHVIQGQQLRQRRPNPVWQRPDRSERPSPRVRSSAQRSAPPADAVGRGRPWRRFPAVGCVDDGLGRADGHPDAERPIARSQSPAQCRRPGVHVGRRAEQLHRRCERRRRHRRRVAAAGIRGRQVQRPLQLARPPAVARLPVGPSPARRARRDCSTSSTSRTSSGHPP